MRRIALAAALTTITIAGCSSNTPPTVTTVTATTTATITATSTVTATATVTATSTATPSPLATPALFAKGYPKVVAAADVPDPMHSWIKGTQAVAVAPGVYTQYVDGVTALEAATTGSPFGFCAAVTKFQTHLQALGYDEMGSTCW